MDDFEDLGETLNVRIETPQGRIPLVISREAMEDHFGAGKLVPGAVAEDFSLAKAFARHEEQITAKAIERMQPGEVYNRDNPLRLRTADF